MIKFLGAALVVAAASSVGLSLAHSVRREVRFLQQLAGVLELMRCEIPGRMAPVQELFTRAQACTSGELREVFSFQQSEPYLLISKRQRIRMPMPARKKPC